MVAPGCSDRRGALTRRPSGVSRDRRGLLRAPGVETVAKRRIVQRQHAGRQQRGIDGAGLADRERADRNAGRHLDDGVKRIRPDSALDSTGTPNTGSSSAPRSCRADAPPRRRRR